MFLGLKNQYCESDSTSHSNVHIQHNPYQITNDILNQNKKFYNLYGTKKRSWISTTILKRKSRAEGIRLCAFRIYYKATVIKTAWYWHKTRLCTSMEQDRESRGKPIHYGHLIYDKGDKTMQWRKDSLFSKCYWENWVATCKRMKLDYFPTLHRKINSKGIKDLNVRTKTMKPLKENIGIMLLDSV